MEIVIARMDHRVFAVVNARPVTGKLFLGVHYDFQLTSRWADNVMIERWFRSLKTEEIYLNEYPTPRALRKAVAAYIQQYNTVRPHQALGYETPEAVYRSCFASPTADLDSLVLAG